MKIYKLIGLCFAAFTIISCAEPVVAESSSEPVEEVEYVAPERPAMEFAAVSRFGFDETIEVLKEAAAAEKYGVQGEHPISEALAKKGFPRERYHVLEVCNPAMAAASLEMDIRAGLNMPCPIVIYEEDGEVNVMTFDTRVLATMYSGDEMLDVGTQVYESMRKIIDSVDVSVD